MSRPVRPPIGAPRHNGSFNDPGRRVPSCPPEFDPGVKSIVGEAALRTDEACSAPLHRSEPPECVLLVAAAHLPARNDSWKLGSTVKTADARHV